jgi:hypothetical protein
VEGQYAVALAALQREAAGRLATPLNTRAWCSIPCRAAFDRCSVVVTTILLTAPAA